MKLRTRVPKATGSGPHREVPAYVTWERINGHLRRAGVTRLADLTGLDRVGIPVYSAIVPRSNDVISVYSGKGVTPTDARTSAAMEALERFAAWLPMRPTVVASYEELAATDRTVLNPRDHSIALSPYYRDDGPISWLAGFDLLNEETVLVPLDAAVYQRRLHEPTTYDVASTNGLASGNGLEEAICHALCELIERDAITLAELISSRLSQVLEQGLAGPARSAAETESLKQRHPRVDPVSLPPLALKLMEMFHRVGVEMRLLDVTSDVGVPSFYACTREDLGPNTSQAHAGCGTHPDAEVAMLRAVTECASARVVDIQAMREDISLPDTQASKHTVHSRRVKEPDRNWAWRAAGRQICARDIASYPNDDVTADIEFMLNQLDASGVPRVIIVDLSPPEIPVRVVRAIAPGLESWIIDQSKISARAAAAWNQAVRDVASRPNEPSADGAALTTAGPRDRVCP